MLLIFRYPPWIYTPAVTKLLRIWEFEDASVFYLFGWFIKSFDVPWTILQLLIIEVVWMDNVAYLIGGKVYFYFAYLISFTYH